MKIIYCTWGEWSADDVCESLITLGNTVIKYDKAPASFIDDEQYETELEQTIKSNGVDIAFTMNYLPVVSKVASNCEIRYVSWVYDCPHLTLYSKTILNKCNHIFIFDRVMAEEVVALGAENVYHMPLAVNTCRIEKQLSRVDSATQNRFKSGVTFLGTLYEDENNRFDQIAGLPDYIKGFVDGLVNSQLLLYGCDLVETGFSDSLCDEVLKHAIFDFGPGFFDIKRKVVRDWIKKKITVKERRGLIDMALRDKNPVTLYAPEKPANLPVDYRGYANYYTEMPLIFNQSKINLNITLRSILSGIPLRVIDILGAGGFCLTNYQPEIAELFENGKELVWYESPEDMLDKIRYYLYNDGEREKIARAGLERARVDFSYESKLTHILSCI